MSTPKHKKWLLLTLGMLLLVGAGLTFRLMFPPFTPPVLPVPNGYDDLLRAAKLLAPRTGFYFEMEKEELAAIVEQNAPALELARKGLQKECMVVVDWSPDQNGLEVHMEYGSSLRGLARAFAAAARQEKAEGRMDDAVQCGLDALALAPEVAQGGLAIDREMAKGVFYGAMHSLREQLEQLSRDDCRRLKEKLQALPLQLETMEEVYRRDWAFFRSTNGFLDSMVNARFTRSQRQQTMTMIQEREKQIAILEMLLQTHLALREFQLDKNQLPKQLSELVPDYLTEVPQDPFASDPLIYRPEANSYQLYSVGTNKVDDQGVETQSGKLGDIILEPSD